MSDIRRRRRFLITDERILLAVNALILIFLGIGIPVFLVGRVLDSLFISTIAAYMILFGIVILVMRIIYWFAEGMIRRGAESMQNEDLLN